ncbi:hypothetical protein [Embleya sp. NPDC001921]
MAPGNAVSASFADAEEAANRYFVAGVDVLVAEGTAIAVAFGDSWFEGGGTSTGSNRRLPNHSGDHLHLNDAGARAMAEAVDLSYLRL